MNTKNDVYAWDTCVILAWLKNESEKNLGDLGFLIKAVENEECTLVMSVIALTEMVDNDKSPTTYETFRGFCKRTNVVLYDVTPEVAELASVIRTRSIRMNRAIQRGNPIIKTADAIHIATAITIGADVFHSYDPDVLKFNQSDVVDGLIIKLPCLLSGQKSLFPTVRLQCRTTMTAHMRSMVFRTDTTGWPPTVHSGVMGWPDV